MPTITSNCCREGCNFKLATGVLRWIGGIRVLGYIWKSLELTLGFVEIWKAYVVIFGQHVTRRSLGLLE